MPVSAGPVARVKGEFVARLIPIALDLRDVYDVAGDPDIVVGERVNVRLDVGAWAHMGFSGVVEEIDGPPEACRILVACRDYPGEEHRLWWPGSRCSRPRPPPPFRIARVRREKT